MLLNKSVLSILGFIMKIHVLTIPFEAQTKACIEPLTLPDLPSFALVQCLAVPLRATFQEA